MSISKSIALIPGLILLLVISTNGQDKTLNRKQKQRSNYQPGNRMKASFSTLPSQEEVQDSLIYLRKQVVKAPNDEARIKANDRFREHLRDILEQDASYKYALDSIPFTGVLQPPDKAFRMFNWNVPLDNNTHLYFCYVQYKNKKQKRIDLYEFQQKEDLSNLSRSVLQSTSWYGALYYEVIPVKKGGKSYYTLLGWDGNDRLTTRKVIDVMQFYSNKPPRLGYGLFNLGRRKPKRIVFEYASDVVMSLRYDKRKKQIVYDHLVPTQPGLEGNYEFYGPDASFDALKLSRGKWVLSTDIDARGSGSSQGYVYPPGLKDPR